MLFFLTILVTSITYFSTSMSLAMHSSMTSTNVLENLSIAGMQSRQCDSTVQDAEEVGNQGNQTNLSLQCTARTNCFFFYLQSGYPAYRQAEVVMRGLLWYKRLIALDNLRGCRPLTIILQI